ncbi:MAG: DUF6298 domain-containing protein [Clostridiales bacterium]|nr:DUF6298 domain-containing protein [Clostridiales bacterium]
MYKNLKQTFNGLLRKNKVNPRYFTDDSGKAIFFAGSHTWAVMNDMWLENEPRHNMDYKGFLQMMEDCYHNFMRFWQFNMQAKGAAWNKIQTVFDPLPFERTGPGLAKDGLPRFNLDKFNSAYFERMRERIELAANKGIYVSIMLFEAWAYKWPTKEINPWPYSVFNPENNVNDITDNPLVDDFRALNIFSLNCPQILEIQKSYIRKVIDTVNDMDNVLYEICNEMPFCKEALEWQEYLCRYIREYEVALPKQHMIGITAEGGDQDNAELFETSADWISPSNGRNFEYRYNPPEADGRKVIVNDTDHLWGHGCETAWLWKCFTRGQNVLFMDPWEPIPGDLDWWQDEDLTKNQRYYYAWDPMRRNLGYIRLFAQMMDLNSCIPHNELCTTTYCLAWTNQQYLCFLPEGGTQSLDLCDADGEFSVQWFEPHTGRSFDGGKLKGGARTLLNPPVKGQVVVFVYKNRNEITRRYEIF